MQSGTADSNNKGLSDQFMYFSCYSCILGVLLLITTSSVPCYLGTILHSVCLGLHFGSYKKRSWLTEMSYMHITHINNHTTWMWNAKSDLSSSQAPFMLQQIPLIIPNRFLFFLLLILYDEKKKTMHTQSILNKQKYLPDTTRPH